MRRWFAGLPLAVRRMALYLALYGALVIIDGLTLPGPFWALANFWSALLLYHVVRRLIV